MIRRPTVFVLGAGASLEYGFPLGSQLRNAIIELAAEHPQPGDVSDAVRSAWRRLLELRKGVISEEYGEPDIVDFGESFKFSGTASIDAYIANRTDHRDVAASLIGAIISVCEQHDLLFAKPKLYWWLLDRLGIEPEKLAENNVTFVTFNYDRSLEYFFARSAKEQLNSSASANAVLDALNVIHMYGSIGGLPRWEGVKQPTDQPYEFWPGKASHNYGILDIERWKVCLRLIGEERSEHDETHVKARKAISEAEVICFLGFGFDPQNMRVLGFPFRGGGMIQSPAKYCGKQRAIPEVLATTIGLSDARKTEVLSRLLFNRPIYRDFKRNFHLMDTGCSELLDNSIVQLQAHQDIASLPAFRFE